MDNPILKLFEKLSDGQQLTIRKEYPFFRWMIFLKLSERQYDGRFINCDEAVSMEQIKFAKFDILEDILDKMKEAIKNAKKKAEATEHSSSVPNSGEGT